ncbi:DNA primase [Luminiphilus sp. nBUS_16]|uniref:DNA primase n=1 Tax=Luminiphilus sp. nBUS_16 TaxID=3395315 RepID=UPI003EC05B0A
MARIPQKFIDDLLDRVDIVEVIDRRVKLKKTGKNFSACCPFHDEKTPSFSVNPGKQFYYCFGCGAGGNALGFLMDYERLEFPEAVESLAQTVGLQVPKEELRPGQTPPQDTNRPILEQLEQATRFYEHSLRKHPEAKRAVAYLKGRGLSGEIARAFRVGFAPPGWDNLLQTADSDTQQIKRLTDGGMLVTNDRGRTYDRFRDRIVFPILDARGRVIAFGGRVLGDDKPKYLNSPETPVFHKSRELYGLYQARKSERSLTRIVVVEGYMDVIALAQYGIGYAVATLGTATSEAHMERLFRHVPEVVFCFDGDEAGRKAAFRALESTLPVMQDGRQARFLFVPDGEDPDSLVRARGAEHLEHLFSSATPLEEFLFDWVAKDLDISTLDGRARFSKQAAPYVHLIPEGVFKTLMYQSLADRTGIDIDSLKRLQAPLPAPEVDQTNSPQSGFSGEAGGYHDVDQGYSSDDNDDAPPPGLDIEPYPGSEGASSEPHHDSLTPTSGSKTQRLLGLLVLNPQLASRLDATLMPKEQRRDIALLTDVIESINSQPDISTASLLGFWHGTPEGQLLTDLAGREPIEDPNQLSELADALFQQLLREGPLTQLRQEAALLKAKPYEALSDSEKQELMRLMRDIRSLSGRS